MCLSDKTLISVDVDNILVIVDCMYIHALMRSSITLCSTHVRSTLHH